VVRALDELIDRWLRVDCIPLRPGVSDDEIHVRERQLNVRLPLQMVAYFNRVDGMPTGVYDRYDIRFLPLQEFSAASTEFESTNLTRCGDFYIFAEYSIWAHGYAIDLGSASSGAIAIVGGTTLLSIADSFDGFIDQYVREPLSVFKPRR
jgi:hypothetical protein